MDHNLATERVSTVDLRLYHRNPRKSDTSRIAESLRVNGQYRPLVVNRGTHTGREHEVLCGNHTLTAARDQEWHEIAVCWVDVDDEQAARIVAADNRTADLGGYDDRLLAELLGDLPDLDGTGYDPGDLDSLLDSLDKGSEDTGGGQEFGQPVVSYTIVFDDDEQQDEWFRFVRWLRDQYPDHETVAGRLMAHIATSTHGDH